jgi:hypothetical protein
MDRGKVNPADGFTKPLDHTKQCVFRSLLGMEVTENGLLGSGNDQETDEEGGFGPDS